MIHRWENGIEQPLGAASFDAATAGSSLLRLFVAGWRAAFLADAAFWCRTQSAIWRGPIWLYLAYAGIRHLFDAEANDLFTLITFAIHELGHLAFSPGGEFIGVAGGSLAQILAPLVALGMFYHQRDYFALCVGGYWLSSSLFNLANYIGDARAQNLELVSPFAALGDGDIIHDWNYLLSHFGLLRLDMTLAFLTRVEAFAVLVASLAWGAWILRRMMQRVR